MKGQPPRPRLQELVLPLPQDVGEGEPLHLLLAERGDGRPVPIHLVAPDEAPPEVALRYQWLQRLLGVPVINLDFQFLGGCPNFFYSIFPHLQDLIMTQGFLATRLATHLPDRAAIRAEEPEADRRIDLFFELLPRLTLLSALVNRRPGCSHEYCVR